MERCAQMSDQGNFATKRHEGLLGLAVPVVVVHACHHESKQPTVVPTRTRLETMTVL